MNQTGSLVTGTYEGDIGILNGTVLGNRFVGTWYNSTDMTSGPFEFVMSPENTYFTGTWAYSSQKLVNATEFWNGIRV